MKKNKNTSKNSINGLVKVQEQYQELPYPLRNPEDEKSRLLATIGESLAEMNHWLYKGKRNFKSGFRVLVAGGGTGDSSTYLAEQLKDTNAEIVYLDFSKTSMEIAQKRAEARGLKNITWIYDSILNIPKLNLGKFDFINCSGVLHHLQSPDDGFKILSDSLTDTGGMHIMIYALIGRTGLYHIQNIMKMIYDEGDSRAIEIKNAKSVMASLPNTNWFGRAQELLQDHITFGDVGLYDMFLHKQDRAYSIPEMYEFIKKANLHFVEFAVPESRLLLKPESYIKDLELLGRIKSKNKITQQAICELISGKIIKHDFFVSTQKDSIASLYDLDNIPYFYYNTANIPKQIYDHLENNNVEIGQTMSFTLNSSAVGCNANISLIISQCTKYIFKNILDGSKTLREIFDNIKQELQVDIKDELLVNEMQMTLTPFFETGILFLRHKSIEPFKDFVVAQNQ